MSTKYFMYTKKGGYAVNDITGCQIINPGSYASMIFVLPESKIDDYYYNGIVGGSLIEWCKQFCSKDGTFIDIGAKTGVYSICLSEVSRNVYSFEKKKLDYYALCGSVALSNQENVTCLQDGAESLDENVLINNEECIKFIKIDLENEELNVLKGAKNLLTKNNYPTILLHTNRNKTPELFDFLENELQYRIVNISGNDNVVLAVCK